MTHRTYQFLKVTATGVKGCHIVRSFRNEAILKSNKLETLYNGVILHHSLS